MDLDMKGKNFLKLLDVTPEEIDGLVDYAAVLKKLKKEGVSHKYCEGKNIALIFEKSSTRTRSSFEVAASDMGINTVFLGPESQLGKKESMKDTARVLGRMFDGIEYRGYEQWKVETLAKYSGVPVWNGLTDEAHPTQILADLLTIKEKFGDYKGKKLVFMGDASFNMGNSMMVGCAKAGVSFTGCCPEKYQPEPWLIEECKKLAEKSGAEISFNADPKDAVKDADVIYTDVWVSMGEPEEIWAERIEDLMPYQVNTELMEAAPDSCVFMHCLPAFHDTHTEVGQMIKEQFGKDCLEVTDEVFESDKSIVFDEAENRLHTIKAVIAATL